MITFELACESDHKFEGWFRNRDDFQEQTKRAIIRCPVCDSSKIRKLPSAVSVHTGKGTKTATPSSGKGAKAEPLSYFRALGEFVEKNFEDVGESFATEARKIASGEEDPRSIRGTTTTEEEESLRDDGIDFFKISLPKYDG